MRTDTTNTAHKAKKLFVIGTSTDVGKTYVSGLIMKKLTQAGLSAAYYKAAMSGNEPGPDGRPIPGDALAVQTCANLHQTLVSMCPYVYRQAVSPHLAAKIEGPAVDMARVRAGLEQLCGQYDYLTMEGSGGIICPIRWDKEQHILLEDLLRELGFGAVMVADAGLGVINSAVLTAEYMKSRGLELRGIIFNNYLPGDPMHEDNREMCQALCGLPVIACVERGCLELPMSTEALAALYA